MKKPIPFGKYLLLERVNVGGMAEVFKAKAFGVEGFERLVAVKRILPSIAEDQEFITMFIDEAKISVQLTHANIASIFDLGKVADSYFIAMEFVRGKDMRAIFDRLSKRGASVPVPMASYVIMKVCEGLDYAHNKRDSSGRELNLVHRDVSPQNILVSYDGEIKLIDFGIAKAANKAGKTQAGILKGKFGYMSPEQVRGLPLDRRSDVFAVGICLYELLTGERLFVGESDFSTLEKVRNVEIMPPRTYNRKIPEELERIVLKALAKDVDDRYQTAMDLHDDLQSFMYTSGNFFARKDLGAWMRKSWAQEIQKEEIRDEQYRHLKAPSPSSSRPPMPGATSRPPAPPPPRPSVSRPPPPPPRPSAPVLTGSQVPSAPTPALDMDWDEDELATQIYDKPELSPIATQAANSPLLGAAAAPSYGAAASGHGDIIPVETAAPKPSIGSPAPYTPAPSGNPSPFDGAPSPFETEPPPRAPSTTPGPREPTAVTRPQGNEKSKTPLIVAAALLVPLLAFAAWVFWPASPGTIQVTTEPVAATVLFDDEPVNATSSPFVISNVEPDMVHNIEVRKNGYTNWVTQVEVAPGQTLVLPTVELVPEEPETVETGFALTTTPPGATVFVDGRQLPERTPVRITDLPAGSHTIRAELDGRAAWQRAVQVSEGSIVDLEARLAPAEVLVRFRSDPDGANVTLVRGTERLNVGRTPVQRRVDVSGDRWTVEMTLSGHEDWQEPLRIPDGDSSTTVSAELERRGGGGGSRVRPPSRMVIPRTDPVVRMDPVVQMDPVVRMDPVAQMGGNGTISINTRPYSIVFIDGRRVGNTPQMNVSLSAGRHRIRLVNPDNNISVTETVNIRSGESTRLIRNLL